MVVRAEAVARRCTRGNIDRPDAALGGVLELIGRAAEELGFVDLDEVVDGLPAVGALPGCAELEGAELARADDRRAIGELARQ